jgi:hypothetical protein
MDTYLDFGYTVVISSNSDMGCLVVMEYFLSQALESRRVVRWTKLVPKNRMRNTRQ